MWSIPSNEPLPCYINMKTIEVRNFGGKLANIYKRQKGKCAEQGCNVRGINNLTRDHIVPIAIARLYGWTKAMYDSEVNLQLLCVAHHLIKDKRNNQRIDKLTKRQMILIKIQQLKYECEVTSSNRYRNSKRS